MDEANELGHGKKGQIVIMWLSSGVTIATTAQLKGLNLIHDEYADETYKKRKRIQYENQITKRRSIKNLIVKSLCGSLFYKRASRRREINCLKIFCEYKSAYMAFPSSKY